MARTDDAELHLDPYVELGCAVIRQAIFDSKHAGLDGEAAKAFLAGPDCVWWAEALGLDGALIRKRVAKAVA